MKKSVSRAAVMAAALTLGLSSAQAATATATLPVIFTVLSSCVVVANGVTFAPNTGGATVGPESATGIITVTCAPATSYTIALDAGQHPLTAGNTTTRRMAGAVNTSTYVSYDLFQDTSHNTHWGATTGTDTKAGSGLVGTYTVYGLLPSQAVNTTDLYTDTVNVTVTY